MELLDYIDPVELNRPTESLPDSDELFNKCITINTGNESFTSLNEYGIALLGVPEERNAKCKGAALAPDAIRNQLYQMIVPAGGLKIIDLGNIKAGNTFRDTYVALRDVTYNLLCQNLVVVLLGGSQDLTTPIYQAFELYQDKINLATIDYRVDFRKNQLDNNSESYLGEIILKKNRLFKYINLGHQSYFTERETLKVIDSLNHQAIRLGQLRNDIALAEPALRDVDIISFDMGALRCSDAPAICIPSPNGLYGEEMCQISRYAGISDQSRAFLISELCATKDTTNQTALLAAQIAWHFIDGVQNRYNEFPSADDPQYKTFIIHLSDLDQDVEFYKSNKTNRWWLRLSDGNKNELIVPCTYNDYLQACEQEVPEIWWKYFQKLNY